MLPTGSPSGAASKSPDATMRPSGDAATGRLRANTVSVLVGGDAAAAHRAPPMAAPPAARASPLCSSARRLVRVEPVVMQRSLLAGLGESGQPASQHEEPGSDQP